MSTARERNAAHPAGVGGAEGEGAALAAWHAVCKQGRAPSARPPASAAQLSRPPRGQNQFVTNFCFGYTPNQLVNFHAEALSLRDVAFPR